MQLSIATQHLKNFTKSFDISKISSTVLIEKGILTWHTVTVATALNVPQQQEQFDCSLFPQTQTMEIWRFAFLAIDTK